MTRHGLDIFLRQAILAECDPYGTGLSGSTRLIRSYTYGIVELHWFRWKMERPYWKLLDGICCGVT